MVALRKESVDRNIFVLWMAPNHLLSLSARRAWIEIVRIMNVLNGLKVALRKESVDRNKSNCFSKSQLARSLSARRAWIEIIECSYHNIKLEKSLSARRAWIEISVQCRLKLSKWSLSARRAWIEIILSR